MRFSDLSRAAIEPGRVLGLRTRLPVPPGHQASHRRERPVDCGDGRCLRDAGRHAQRRALQPGAWCASGSVLNSAKEPETCVYAPWMAQLFREGERRAAMNERRPASAPSVLVTWIGSVTARPRGRAAESARRANYHPRGSLRLFERRHRPVQLLLVHRLQDLAHARPWRQPHVQQVPPHQDR